MGIGDLSPDDQEQSEENDSQDPSVSYIYIYERGRDEIDNWPQDEASAAATAYQVTSGGGNVRNRFKSSGRYVNIHSGMSDYLAALGTAFGNDQFIVPVHQAMPNFLEHLAAALEEDDWTGLLEFTLKDDDPEHNAQVIQDFLEENPEVRQELAESEAAPADD